MTKKRKKESVPREFRNNPFRSLKGVTTQAPAQRQAAPASPSSGPATDDAELFARAMQGARRLEGNDSAEGPVPVTGARMTTDLPSREDSEDRLFLESINALGTSNVRLQDNDDDARDDEAGRRSMSSRMRRLRKGTIRIAQELDLHGSVRDEAIRRLRHFVAAAHARSDQAVLVITGKGHNSAEGPVLPAAVDEWLRGPGREMVAEFHPAPRDKGGSGAVVVFLRTPN